MSDKIVEEHRKMVIVSGKLSDFQMNNLKHYPFIVLGDDIQDVKIDYSFVKPGTTANTSGAKMEEMFAGVVQYDFKFKKDLEYSREELIYRLGQLTSWVQYLFWVNTEVRYLKDGKPWMI